MTIRRPWKLSVANRLPLSCRNSQQPYLGESGSVIRRALLIKRGSADFFFFLLSLRNEIAPRTTILGQLDDVLSRNCLISFFFFFFSFLSFFPSFPPKGAVSVTATLCFFQMRYRVSSVAFYKRMELDGIKFSNFRNSNVK